MRNILGICEIKLFGFTPLNSGFEAGSAEVMGLFWPGYLGLVGFD